MNKTEFIAAIVKERCRKGFKSFHGRSGRRIEER